MGRGKPGNPFQKPHKPKKPVKPDLELVSLVVTMKSGNSYDAIEAKSDPHYINIKVATESGCKLISHPHQDVDVITRIFEKPKEEGEDDAEEETEQEETS